MIEPRRGEGHEGLATKMRKVRKKEWEVNRGICGLRGRKMELLRGRGLGVEKFGGFLELRDGRLTTTKRDREKLGRVEN